MVALRPDAAPFAHFQRHRAADDIARCQILGRWGVAFHEPFTFGIGQVAALAPCALGDQHARAVNAGGVELHEFHVLQRQPCAQHHAAAVAGAGVRAGRGVVAAAITAGRQHDALRFEPMDAAIVEAHGDHTAAHAVFHDQVEREIFDEEIRVVFQALLIQRVQHGMAGAVGGGAGALDRWPLAHILHVPAERALVDRAIVIARKRHACMLQLVHRLRSFARQIFDRVLIAQPVRTLHGVVHMPGPVIGRVVAQRCGDAALRRDGVRPRRENLGDIGGFQPGFRRAHRGAQARSARADDHDVVHVVDNLVGRHIAAVLVPVLAPRRARMRSGGRDWPLCGSSESETGDAEDAEGTAADGGQGQNGQEREFAPGFVDVIFDQDLQAHARMPEHAD